MTKLLAAGVVCLSVLGVLAEPKTIYVDQSVASSGDGTSWATAVKTIQEGVNKASTTEVDTVLVAPGTYADEPGMVEPTSAGKYLYYRVKLDRKVILKSDKGKEVTHIVGRPGDGQGFSDPETGLPPVMCVYIPAAGQGSVVEGFTIRDGEVPVVFGTAVRSAGVGNPAMTSNDNYYLGNEPEKFWYVAYCTISNCCGGRGVAVSGGTLISSVIADNHAYTNGSTVATTYVHAYNSLFARNSAPSKQGAQAFVLVNCLVVDDDNRGMSGVPNNQAKAGVSDYVPRFYNSAIFNECGGSAGSWGVPACTNCLIDSQSNGNMVINAASANNTPIPVGSVYTNLVMSTITGDYRPVKGGRLDGKGDPNALDLDFIPAAYARRDFNGNLLAADAPVPIGLVLPAAEPASAPLVAGTGMKLNGSFVGYANSAHYEESWPSVVRLSAADGKEDLFVGVSVNPYMGEVGYRKFRSKYDSVPLTLPPLKDSDGNELPALVVSKLQAAAENVLWVDDDAEFSGEPDGSAEKPYRTIQAAVDAAGSTFHIVNVRAGTYNTGYTVDSTGIRARVVIPSTANLLIRGVDGAATTFVEGAPDPDTLTDATNPGIGLNACRCFWMHSDSNVALSGLTLRKGYGGPAASNGTGGAIYCGSNKQQAYDCVFTDNHIIQECAAAKLQGSCCNYGWLVRCTFTDNLNYNRGIIKNSTLSACQIVHNARGGANNANAERYGWQEGDVYQTTVYEPDFKNGSYSFHTSARTENCVLVGGDLVAGAGQGYWTNNIAFDFVNNRVNPEAVIRRTDPWLASVERHDFHPVTGSPVIGYVEFSKSTDRLGARLRNICTDFENKPVFAENGNVTIGAFATMHEQANVYVDATGGDDENDGTSETSAKKTLAAAVGAVCRKDTIVALPGTYKEGSMIHSVISSGVNKPLTVRARVVVPDGSELVAQGSAAETIIEGEPDPDPQGSDTFGLGANAMRGVVLGKGSVLRGFTVTKGRTAIYDATLTGYSDNIQGAGVLGRSPAESRVENCVLTGNYGDCGGGGAYVTFDHCRIVGNRTTRFGSGFRSSSAVNCYFNDNWGERVCEGVVRVLGCTFGESNMRPDGTSGTMMLCQAGNDVNPIIRNVLVLSIATTPNDIKSGDVRYCIFPQGATFNNCTTVENVNTEYSLEALRAFYANGVPTGVGAPSVDAGVAVAEEGETDLAGDPRVLNGAIDVGCYEADWKPQYAKDLGGRSVTVTQASPNVREVDGKVVLTDGTTIAADLSATGGAVTIGFTVTDGTLTLTRNGQTLGEYTSGQSLSLARIADLESYAFSYAGTGSATLSCCKVQLGMIMIMR